MNISAPSSHFTVVLRLVLMLARIKKIIVQSKARPSPLLIPLCYENCHHLCLFVMFVTAVTDKCRPKTPQVCCFRSRQDVQRLSIESSGKTLPSDFDLSSLHPMRSLCVCVCVCARIDSKTALCFSASDCGTFTGNT